VNPQKHESVRDLVSKEGRDQGWGQGAPAAERRRGSPEEAPDSPHGWLAAAAAGYGSIWKAPTRRVSEAARQPAEQAGVFFFFFFFFFFLNRKEWAGLGRGVGVGVMRVRKRQR
jgi:hypothetical protein